MSKNKDKIERKNTSLIIVESPVKAATIKGFLGPKYKVLSSYGHVRDLPKSELGIDLENNFEPKYIVPLKAKKNASLLKKEASKANSVILASVDHEEPTLIQYPDGLVHIEKVGEFIDWLIDSSISPSQFRVAAFDPASHCISFKQIKHAIKHLIKGKLLRIKTDYGRTITITASHSLFQKNVKGTIKTVAGKNLKKGDFILVPTNIPIERKELAGKQIDILRAIYKNGELRNKVFIKSSSIAEYRKSQLLAPRNDNTPQFTPRIFFTDEFRNKLQENRSAQGWSQRTLATQIECSQSDISEWENGRGNPTLERGKKYLDTLGLKFNKLVATKEVTVGPSSIEQAIARAIETQWRDSRKSKSRSWQPLNWFTWEELEQRFSKDKTIEISRSNHSHCMPRFISVDRDLMLFLGFFIAEGSFLTHGKYTRFSFGPKTHGAEGSNIKCICEITKRLFNLNPSDFKQKTGHSVVLNSTLITFFLKEILGIKKGAGNKNVPNLIFNVSRKLQFVFLKGCFLGDGTLGKRSITFNTISPSLASGISYLLLQNGLIASSSVAISKKPNRKPLHQITITGKEKLTTVLPIWEEHYKAQLLKEYCKKNINSSKQNFSLIKQEGGDLALLRIKNIEKVKPSSHYAYDFSVEGENFVCGNGGICAHNTDEDREGEAIAYHLAFLLGLNGEVNEAKASSSASRLDASRHSLKEYQRIVFHEITESAIKEALGKPRKIDMALVFAQQARRILDRIVGYKLSPFLWKKVARGLSAGRVQSVAVRLVVEREREIQKFVPAEYWTVTALLKKPGGVKLKQSEGDEDKSSSSPFANARVFEATLIAKDGKLVDRLEVKNGKEAEKIIKDLNGADYLVEKIEKKEIKRNPFPPLTTSTLQQESWKKFRFPARLTMRLAQQLYENGLITYHRTDSVNLSTQSLFAAKEFIIKEYGEKYWAGFFRKYKTKSKNAQEAHEAIRPTFPDRTPDKLKIVKEDKSSFPSFAAARLYELIWKRFIASQMQQAIFDTVAVDITARNYTFRANGQTLKFDGFLKVDEAKASSSPFAIARVFEERELPKLKEEEALDLVKITPDQHFTEPPARYNEASLIKALEENGIGRPSTYAPILSNIQDKNYIEKNEQRRFQPTEIGTVVNDLLVKHFPTVIDIDFTAQMEEELDEIAQAKKEWVPVINEFYKPFAENLKQKYEEVSKKDITEKPTEKTCPKCGAPLIIRIGRYGQFYACSKFPKCRHTESLEKNVLGIKCPKCKKGEIVEKRTKRRKIFYGCNRFPECDFALWDKPTGEFCPKCKSLLITTKRRQVKCSNAECRKKRAVDEDKSSSKTSPFSEQIR